MVPVAIPFKNNFKLNDEAQEFNIKFDPKKNDFNKLIEFVQEYENKRINIEFPAEVDIPTMRALTKVANNVYVRLFPQDFKYIAELRKNDCRFFPDSMAAATNYTTLESFLSLGVSDVYIADDLCYNIEKVYKICQNNNAGIRLVANRIPLTSFNKGEDRKAPIYRPQDYYFLKLYISTFEFDCVDTITHAVNWNKLEVLYRVWFQEQKWNGDLREINSDLKFYFPNASVIPDFNDYKMDCGRRCSADVKNSCRKCEQFIDIGCLLDSKNIRIKREANHDQFRTV